MPHPTILVLTGIYRVYCSAAVVCLFTTAATPCCNTISFYRHFISIYQFHHHVALLALCGSVSTLYVLMWGCQAVARGVECGLTPLMCAHRAGVYYLPLPTSAHQPDGGDLGLALKVIRVIAGDKSGCSMLADHRRGVTGHIQEMQGSCHPPGTHYYSLHIYSI